MAFPLELPAAAFRCRDSGLEFELDPDGEAEMSSPTWGGLVQTIGVGRRLWRARYDLVPLREDDAREVIAALHRMRGGVRRFRALNPLRRTGGAYPNGYAGLVRAGGGAFDGTATIAAVGEFYDTLQLSGLPSGFVIKPDDHLSFGWATSRQALHAVTVGGTANGAGFVTVTVEPTIIPGVSAEKQVSLLNPWFKAQYVRRSLRVTRLLNRRYAISFAGIQDIRP